MFKTIPSKNWLMGAAELEDDTDKSMTKTLNNSTVKPATAQVEDLEIVGNVDMFRLLCKASSQAEGWMKSTKAMQIGKRGCIVQVTTQQRGDNGEWGVAEALTWVPGAQIEPDKNGGRKLI